MEYQKHYNQLIKTRKDRELDPEEYYENHHILPRCIGGDNTKFNMVYLTAREHYIAH